MAGARCSDKIFGTPPEPIFNADNLAMKPEMLQDWLQVLEQQNKDNMNAATCNQGHFKNGDTVDFVFNVCKRFRLPDEARYVSIELFDKFIVQHIDDLYKHVQKSNSSTKLKDWRTILGRVRKQIALRIVSCCQLASKLSSHCKAVTPGRAFDFLHELGHKYSQESILQSELRVLKTLNYKVCVLTPLLFIETILEIVGFSDESLSVQVCHGTCIMLLDMVYLDHKPIYRQLLTTAYGLSSSHAKHKAMFRRVENDFLLLAVSVIAAAYYVVDQTHADKIMHCIHKISGVPLEDILDFATILVQHILED